MKRSHKIAFGLFASLSLGMAVATAQAHPGPMGRGMGPGFGPGMMAHGMGLGFGPGMGPAATGRGPAVAQQLMTPEERTAIQDKMRNAKTPEERQQLAQATRAEMEKRATEKGITLPGPRGPGAGFGPAIQTR
jgi:Spy/CpxP family protein refolding chaperone